MLVKRRSAARLLIAAAVSLVLGLTVSVAVAVGFALLGTVSQQPPAVAVLKGGLIQPASGDENVAWSEILRDWGAPVTDCSIRLSGVRGMGVAETWSQFSLWKRQGGAWKVDQLGGAWHYRTGWPLKVLHRRTATAVGHPVSMVAPPMPAWAAPKWLTRATYIRGTLNPSPPVPLGLLPLGLAINTAFFGALAFGAYVVLGPGRRLMRIRRGLCPSCCYDLAGLAAGAVCPECGKQEEKSLASAGA